MGRIVVGVDGSQQATDALRWAAREAVVRGWRLTAVMAWDHLDQHHAGRPRPGQRQSGDLLAGRDDDLASDDDQAAAEQALEELVLAAVGHAAPTVVLRATLGLAAAVLVEAARGAELLVLGPRGRSAVRGLLVGSVSLACLRDATCPVAIIRIGAAPTTPTDPRIVVGVDTSPESAAALGWALDESRARGSTLEAVHTWSVPIRSEVTYSLSLDPTPYEYDARCVLDTALRQADTSGLTSPVVRTIVAGDPLDVILDAAKAADLVVVGSRPRGTLHGMVLGALNHGLAQQAPCPVVLVPAVLT